MRYGKNHTHYKLILSEEEVKALQYLARHLRDEREVVGAEDDEEEKALLLTDKILKIK